MANKFIKSAIQVQRQIELWFLKYYGIEEEDLEGDAPFTFFRLLQQQKQSEIFDKLNLLKNEIPVLFLKVTESDFIVTTTHSFIKIESQKIERINYQDFEGHKGFRPLGISNQNASVKMNGYISTFYLLTTTKEYCWNIPTGETGFAFWNITKKCELIGRKYIID